MQRSINIQNATINAFADIQFGLATVVANAAAGTTSMRTHVSKCSDPGKSGDPSPRRWRGSGSSYRHEHRQVVAVHPVARTGVCGSTPTTPSTLPPTLWAAWVLSQSLCG
ncbi:MAG TPA: hypothetical protein VM165_08925 [Planctomycetaceae bacterium]|nr:hypothetical protein [Planctomycetaceae bacterium]